MFDNSLKKDVSFGKMIHLFLVTMHTTERSSGSFGVHMQPGKYK